MKGYMMRTPSEDDGGHHEGDAVEVAEPMRRDEATEETEPSELGRGKMITKMNGLITTQSDKWLCIRRRTWEAGEVPELQKKKVRSESAERTCRKRGGSSYYKWRHRVYLKLN